MRLTTKNISWWKVIILTISLFVLSTLLSTITTLLFLVFNCSYEINYLLNDPNVNITIGFITFPILLFLTILTNKIYFKDTILSLGIHKKNCIKYIIVGAALGTSFISAVFIINYFFSNISVHKQINIQWDVLLIITIAFIFQGFTEEVLTRGFLMSKIAKEKGRLFTIIASSTTFTILHCFNPNINLISLINIFLAGLIFSLLFYLTGSMWITGFAHSLWNITLGVILGINVSGQKLPSTLLKTISYSEYSLFNGGEFGFEGGIITTFVSIFIILILYKLTKNHKV
ncbi:CPBP family intramembrane glutamic endopeptidase [Staphylococcus aureus]|uniref:CPBP family intramembrane glutamic endopeptidase n=1 Tax=Staphylococcus aureus TaxID=1280 RepID=UPI001BFE1081|nr:CPBP family intramembrane glutamic endopeptidase [Staphylococcus aureus]MCW0257247.1 CPBP family intramembrane metalloprotease [Staphylococcus aureus]